MWQKKTCIKRLIIAAAFIFYLVTAVSSTGYYHPDEHYQIVEFAAFKRGTIAAHELPWEYGAKIRSAFQPAVCYVVFNVLNACGIDDPHDMVMVLRIITALLALVAICLFVNSSLIYVHRENRNLYLFLSFFLWFLPFLNVRFSSETWSGLFFLAGLAVLQWRDRPVALHFFLTGFLMGLSFLCRFQSGILCMGIVIWLAGVKKAKPAYVLALLLAMAMVAQCGVFIDYWFYGAYTYTSWNYLYQTLLAGTNPKFGTEPWYFFFTYLLNGYMLPFGVWFLFSILLVMITKPAHPVLWCMVPFVAVHCVVVHKEDRFLFPLVNMLPVILVLAWQQVKAIAGKRTGIRFMTVAGKYVIPGFVLLLNIIALALASFRAPGNGNKNILQYIHKQYGHGPIRLLFCDYNPLYAPLEKFYQDKQVKEYRLNDVLDLEKDIPARDSVNLLVIYKSTLNDPLCPIILRRLQYTLQAQSVAGWVQWLSTIHGDAVNREVILLYKRR